MSKSNLYWSTASSVIPFYHLYVLNNTILWRADTGSSIESKRNATRKLNLESEVYHAIKTVRQMHSLISSVRWLKSKYVREYYGRPTGLNYIFTTPLYTHCDESMKKWFAEQRKILALLTIVIRVIRSNGDQCCGDRVYNL